MLGRALRCGRPVTTCHAYHLAPLPPLLASPSSTRWGATQPPPRPGSPWSSTLESGWPCSTRLACSPPPALAGVGSACLSAVQLPSTAAGVLGGLPCTSSYSGHATAATCGLLAPDPCFTCRVDVVYDVAAGRLYLIGTIPDPLQDAVVTGERCCCGLCLLPMCAHKMLRWW